MSKRMGQTMPYSISQNFLTSRRTIDRLLRLTNIRKQDTVLEIGAGKGHITKALAEVSDRVISYEIDSRLHEKLQPQLPGHVKLHCGDFLKCRLPGTAYKVFANIPFSITTDIVRKLTNEEPLPEAMWLIMEKGAAKRFCGLPKDNLSSLLIKPFFDTKIVYHFRREDFHPAPRVDTVLLEFKAKQNSDVSGAERQAYAEFLSHSFRYGLVGSKALLTKKQIATALKNAKLPPLKPADDILYIQWLCLFRCWLRFGQPK